MNIQLGSKGINWTDATWNPITGCLHGCPYCYARAFAQRYGRSFTPAFHPERVDEPMQRRKPTRIFVGSSADVFGDWVPDTWIHAILQTVNQCRQHTFQFLTKAPHNLAKFNPWPRNSWVGATVDVKARFTPTLVALRKVRAPVRFISFEPLLEDMGIPLLAGNTEWIIIGAQTGKDSHQPDPIAVKHLLDTANACKIPILMKDNLIWQSRREEFPAAIQQLTMAL